MRINFNADTYLLGSTGFVTVYLSFQDTVDVDLAGVYLIFLKFDGSLIVQFFGQSYAGSSLFVPGNANVSLSYNFKIPDVKDIVSGGFYYITLVSYGEHGTQSFVNSTSLPRQASFGDKYCYLSNPSHPPYIFFDYVLTGYKMNYTILKNNYTTLSQNYASLSQDYASLSQNYTSFKQDYGRLYEAYTNLNRDYVGLQQDFNTITATVDVLRSQINTLQILLAATTVILVCSLVGTLIFFSRKIIRMQRVKTVGS